MKRTPFIALLLSLALIPAPVAAASAPAGISQQQATELVTSYAHLTAEFYKKVDKQAVLDGARSNLIAYLQLHGVAHPKIDALHASTDDATNARTLERFVSSAIDSYATKIGDVVKAK